MFLHATQLTFEQPITGESIRIDAPLWPDFEQALKTAKLVKGETPQPFKSQRCNLKDRPFQN
jgi:hypothetical protein